MKSIRNRSICLILSLLALMTLVSCSSTVPVLSHSVTFQSGTFDTTATELTVSLAKGESRLLERFPNLTSVDLTGSEDLSEVDAYAKAHPEISVRCNVSLLGQTVAYNASGLSAAGNYGVEEIQSAIAALPYLTSLDLRACALDNSTLLAFYKAYPNLSIRCMIDFFGEPTDNQTASLVVKTPIADPSSFGEELAQVMSLFPALQSIDLTQLDTELSPETIHALQQRFPAQKILYTFELFGREINTTDTEIDLYEVRVTNDGVPQLKQVLACLPDCTYVDMAYTKVDNETMAALAAEFPKIKFSWMIHFAAYSCRTDANMVKASKPFYGFTSDVADVLKYCTDLEYLDIGHNHLTDLSFLSNMKNLKVLIAAISFKITDISPIANCTQLEYLELFTNQISDVSPLSGLTQLKHLNLCSNKITDASPLYSLQNLERLWISNNLLSEEQKKMLVEKLPNCQINLTTQNPTAEGWKKGPRYDLLSEQFHYGSGMIYERFGTYAHP